MTTVGEQVENRLLDLERAINALQGATTVPQDVDSLDGPAVLRIQQQVALLKSRVDSLTDAPGRASDGMRDQYMKELMPAMFGDGNYKEIWRTWSYKCRDWFAQWDDSLRSKLQQIESQKY